MKVRSDALENMMYDPPIEPQQTPPWYCPTCTQYLNWDEVTYDERHDERLGGCGEHVAPTHVPLTPDEDE